MTGPDSPPVASLELIQAQLNTLRYRCGRSDEHACVQLKVVKRKYKLEVQKVHEKGDFKRGLKEVKRRANEGGSGAEALNKTTYVFLSVFKWEARKGWDILLKAFLEEFAVSRCLA